MSIKQISVFLVNKKGTLAEITKILADACIDLKAMTIADTADYGIFRIITNNYALTAETLSKHEYITSITDVVAICIPDKIGGLCEVLELLDKENIDVEYSYSFIYGDASHAYIVLRVNDIEKTEKILNENSIKIINEINL